MNNEKKGNQERILKILLMAYILFMIKMIVFKYSFAQLRAITDCWQKNVIWEGLSTANFTPFKTIRMYIKYYDMPGIKSFENLYGNILIFIPFGFLLSRVHPVCRNLFVLLANAFLFVLGIEVFQLFSAFGAFDVDDIMLNIFGAVIGGIIYHIYEKLVKKEKCNKNVTEYRKD